MSGMDTLIIGDTHGNLNRLEALLHQEGILTMCRRCEGTGDDRDGEFCVQCGGYGECRSGKKAHVIHIGDLIHGGYDTQGADEDTVTYAIGEHWIDDLIWGNHERGLIDPTRHRFGGMGSPNAETMCALNSFEREGSTHFAMAVHGFLLTHAGLGEWHDKQIPDDLDEAVETLNLLARNDCDMVHSVSYARGGASPAGGILWRDDSEPISTKFDQVYGHTADQDGLHRTHENDDKIAYKIDIGGKHEARLGGLWLPERRLVKVDLGLKG